MEKQNQIIKEGSRFTRWLVLEKAASDKWWRKKWLCKCDCGKKKIVSAYTLKKEISKSCGCLRNELIPRWASTHGQSHSPFYTVWMNIHARTKNKKLAQYKSYGGRGIKCEWKSFEEFRDDMQATYKKGLSIDRIDNNGNYSKENCRWATRKEQQRNTNRNIKYKGETAIDASRRLGGNKELVRMRVTNYKWDIKRAFTTPVMSLKRLTANKTFQEL